MTLPKDLRVVRPSGSGERQLQSIRGEKIITFVSADCPISMVETVIKARELAAQKKDVRLVAPLQKLSDTHLAMNRMVSNGSMLFMDDEQWRKENMPEKIRLPLFVQLQNEKTLPLQTSTK